MIKLEKIVMLQELKRKGLSISAIALRTGLDRKTVRKHLYRGLAAPAYSPREPRNSSPPKRSKASTSHSSPHSTGRESPLWPSSTSSGDAKPSTSSVRPEPEKATSRPRSAPPPSKPERASCRSF